MLNTAGSVHPDVLEKRINHRQQADDHLRPCGECEDVVSGCVAGASVDDPDTDAEHEEDWVGVEQFGKDGPGDETAVCDRNMS